MWPERKGRRQEILGGKSLMLLVDWAWTIKEKEVDKTLQLKFPTRMPLSCPSCIFHIREWWIAFDSEILQKSATLNLGATTTVTVKDFVWPCVHKREGEMMLTAQSSSAVTHNPAIIYYGCPTASWLAYLPYNPPISTQDPNRASKKSLLWGKICSCPTVRIKK